MTSTKPNIYISIEIVVEPESGYIYKVINGATLSLQYTDELHDTTIHFGSLEEMKAVALAMLKIVDISAK